LCCLVYDVNYNRETTENSAIYFDSVQSLLDKINFIFENKKRAKEVGLTLAAIARRRYKWSNIINKYNYVFSELLNQS
jgi:glycosyltransferase involved in cell wall biosynthesis